MRRRARQMLAAAALLAAAGCTQAAAAPPGRHHRRSAPGPGTTLILAGSRAGEVLDVTLITLTARAAGGHPEAGQRIAGAVFRVVNAGTVPWTPVPDGDSVLTAPYYDRTVAGYLSGAVRAAGCAPFPQGVAVPPGGTVTGCLSYDLPAGARIRTVSWADDTGMHARTGIWRP